MKHILVTNDDGIYSPGLNPLVSALRRLGKIYVVVPNQSKSAVSHAITLDRPLRVYQVKNVYTVNGTPADCVRLAILSLIRNKVDLVVSGINEGPNMGEDVIYSATVAAAREAAMLGIPGLAVSLSIRNGKSASWRTAAKFAYQVSKWILKNGLPAGIFFNLNIPDVAEKKIKGFVITKLGKRIYSEKIDSRIDPRGLKYYWLAGATPSGVNTPGTDIAALKKGMVSLTPLRYDSTAYDLIDKLKPSRMKY